MLLDVNLFFLRYGNQLCKFIEENFILDEILREGVLGMQIMSAGMVWINDYCWKKDDL